MSDATDLAALHRAEAARVRRATRADQILGAPEARGRQKLAFALALRLDLDADAAIQILAEAPDDLETVDEIRGYVAAIVPDPVAATRH